MPSENQPSDSHEPAGKPLRGKTVLVTRAAGQSKSLGKQLEQLGAKVVLHPVIEIKPVPDLGKLDASLKKLQSDEFGWVVFASGNGVNHFASRLGQLDISIDVLNRRNVAAIGTATQTQLKSLGIENICSPKVSNSQSLAELVIEQANDQRVLIIRANRGSEELRNRLQEAEIDFEEVVAYHSVDVETPDPEVLEMMTQGEIDWITLTSSAIANSAIKLFSEAIAQSGGKTKTVSISPRTSRTMRALGFEPDAEATEFNMPGIITAMQNSN